MFMMVLYIVPYASLALRHVLSLRISRRSTLFYFLFYFVLLCSTLFYFVLLLVIHTSVLWWVCLSYDSCACLMIRVRWVCLSYDASYDSSYDASYDASYDECACCTITNGLVLDSSYDSWWLCHGRFGIAEFISFSWNLQPISSRPRVCCVWYVI